MLRKALDGPIYLAIGILLAFGVFGGAVFVWSGIYNVSAAREHFDITTWILKQVRDQSVATQSSFIDVPALDVPSMIKLGGAHYESVCVTCHARPGASINVVVAQMLPSPPHLSEALTENSPEEIFWVVKHGLKYTGMPAFPTQKRDDEVWAVTAFLSALAKSEKFENYPAISGLERIPASSDRSAKNQLMQGTELSTLTQCIRCHDDAGISTHTDTIPRLAGQSAEYLRRSLQEYASGKRPSGIMQPVGDTLSPADIERLARHYAQMPASPQTVVHQQDRIARGRKIAETGDLEADIPACLSCHGAGRARQFANLGGQNAAYLERQLILWQGGGRALTTYGQIMAPIARRLSPDQIRDVAVYFQSLLVPSANPATDPGDR